jgi:hypothetical protein
MKKAFWVLILAGVIFTLAGCNLFFDPKMVSYSVTSLGAPVPIDIVAAGEDGIVFRSSTWTDWGDEFEVKYTDFPFLAHIAVTNKGVDEVSAAIYRDDKSLASMNVPAGQHDFLTTSVSY